MKSIQTSVSSSLAPRSQQFPTGSISVFLFLFALLRETLHSIACIMLFHRAFGSVTNASTTHTLSAQRGAHKKATLLTYSQEFTSSGKAPAMLQTPLYPPALPLTLLFFIIRERVG